MKILHKFTVELEKEVEKTEVSVVDGKEQKLIKKEVTKVPHKVVLKNLGRGEKDSFKLFYGAQIKRALNHGMISRAVLINNHIDGTGALISKETVKRMVELENAATQCQNDLIALGVVDGDENKEAIQRDLLVKMIDAKRELQAIEVSNQTIFNNTAENYAQERANFWLVFNQSYVETAPDKYEPIFKGSNYEEKEASCTDLEDKNDPLFLAAVDRLTYFWAMYFLGKLSTPEEFQAEEDRLKAEADERARQLTEEILGKGSSLSEEVAETPTEEPVTTST